MFPNTRLISIILLTVLGLMVPRLTAAAAQSSAFNPLFRTFVLDGTEAAIPAVVHGVVELEFIARATEGAPFLDVEIDGVVEGPGLDMPLRVPAFWAGGDRWKVRFGPPQAGRYVFRAEVVKGKADFASPVRGVIDATPYTGDNLLLKRGPVRVNASGRFLEHTDGTPFFLLADSWWHGMTWRLPMADFKTLVADRVAKGFNTIQFAVANPCDIAPFDVRGGNEAGHGWTDGFGTINPAYWDLTDQRIMHLIEEGLLPSILGTWAYYVHFMGDEKVVKHWRYIIARYGAFPVKWILCGESRLPWYPLINKGPDGYEQTLRWTKISKEVARLNTTGRILAVHPGPPLWFHDAKYEALADYSAIDLFYGMGGHGSGRNEYGQVVTCLEQMATWRKANPGKPAIIGELAWEGMFGAQAGPVPHPVHYWGRVLNGAPGHCYGADALWQMNSRALPFGESVQGYTWGNWPWEEAMHWDGATFVSIGKRIMEKFDWWRFESHPEWLQMPPSKPDEPFVAAAAGIPGEVRIHYIFMRHGLKLAQLEPGKSYAGVFVSPIDGQEYPLAKPLLASAEGTAEIPRGPINQDWLLVIRPANR